MLGESRLHASMAEKDKKTLSEKVHKIVLSLWWKYIFYKMLTL